MFTVHTQFTNVVADCKYNLAGHVFNTRDIMSFTSRVAHKIVV